MSLGIIKRLSISSLQEQTDRRINAVARKLGAMPASSSSAAASSSSITAGKAAIDSADRITFANPNSEDYPESLTLKRKRQGKNLPSKAYPDEGRHSCHSDLARTLSK